MMRWVIVAACFLAACSAEPYYLDVKYIEIDDTIPADTVEVHPVVSDEPYYGLQLTVRDSLGIFYLYDHPKAFYEIRDLCNGADLGLYCLKGNGPTESTSMKSIDETYEKAGCRIAEIFDFSRYRIFVWNITRSVAERRTVCDTIIEWQPGERRKKLYDWRARLDDDRYLTCTHVEGRERIHEVIAPRLLLTDASCSRIDREYRLFADSIFTVPPQREWLLQHIVRMYYCLKPDKTQAAMTMALYPQLNLLDLETGEVRGFRIRTNERVSLEKQVWQYGITACDDRAIYAFYVHRDRESVSPARSMIHVFDWDGRLIRRWVLDAYYGDMCVDGDRLYVYNSGEGRLGWVDLSALR